MDRAPNRRSCPEAAVRQALQLIEEGADLLDIGGEPTRPGAAAVPVDEELSRVIPVVEQLAEQTSITLADSHSLR